jgi:hypothetical protein
LPMTTEEVRKFGPSPGWVKLPRVNPLEARHSIIPASLIRSTWKLLELTYIDLLTVPCRHFSSGRSRLSLAIHVRGNIYGFFTGSVVLNPTFMSSFATLHN